MSWFGGGLSQFSSLTDQISNFTKEVLTETTEEVEDPAAELQVARKKVNELENLNRHIQAEWERVKHHNEELSERADTAEFQISTISKEYRKLFQEKEDELRRLKGENAHLRDQQKKLLPDGAAQSPLKQLASVRFFPPSEQADDKHQSEGDFPQTHPSLDGGGWGTGDGGAWDLGTGVGIGGEGWEEEFHDLVSSQSEINRLQSELARLRVECQHWRRVAQEKTSLDQQTEVGGVWEGDTALLREQIELSHRHELDQHQHELTALQSLHDERLQSLTQTHKHEISELRQRLQEVHTELTGYRDGEQDDVGREALRKELEGSRARCAQLEGELTQLKLREREDTQLAREVELAKASPGDVLSLRDDEERKVLNDRIDKLESLLEELREECRGKESLLNGQELSLKHLQSQLRKTEEVNQELRGQLHRLTTENTGLQETNLHITAQLEREQLNAAQFHGEIDTLKQQLTSEKNNQIQQLEEEKHNLASTLTNMESSIQEDKDCIYKLRSKHEQLQIEVEKLTAQTESLGHDVKEKEAEIATIKRRESETAESLRASMGELEAARLQLYQENSSLKESNEELKSQVARLEESLQLQGERGEVTQDEITKLKLENDQLAREVSEMKTGSDNESTKPGNGIENLHQQILKLSQQLRAESLKRERLQSHLLQLSEENDRELSLLLTEKESLLSEIGSLREDSTHQLQNDTQSECTQLRMENAQLSDEISRQMDTISHLEVEVKRLQSLPEMESMVEPIESGAREEMHTATGFEEVDLDSYGQFPSAGTHSSLMEKLRHLESSVADKKNVISELRASNNTLTSSIQSLQDGLEQLKEEKLDLEQRLQVAEEQLSIQNQQEATNSQELARLQLAVTEKEDRIAQLETETLELKSKALSEEEDLRGQLDDSLQQLKHHEQHLEELGEMVSARDGEIAELRRESSEQREKEVKIRGEFEVSYSKEKALLVEKITQLEQESRSSEVETSTQEVEYLQGNVQEVSQALEAMSNEFTQVASERDGLEASLRARRNEISQLTVSLHQAKEEHHKQILSLNSTKEDLLQQLNYMKPQFESLRRDKSQLEVKVQSLESSCDALQREMEGRLGNKQAECTKLAKELERLKTHLIEVEDQYTQETLKADEREVALRQQLSHLEDRLRMADTAGTHRSHQTHEQLERLQEQLQSMEGERDNALQQLAMAQEKAEQHATALHNLQAVLEQFQRDQSSELSLALKRSQLELADALQECEKLRKEQILMQSQLEEASVVAENATVLGQMLGEKENRVLDLTREVEKMHANLNESQFLVEKLSKDDNSKVDKGLMKNLVVGYIQASDRKKPEVLRVIGRILELTPEELDQMLEGRSGWLSGLWRRTPANTQTEETASLSRLFVNFLEVESGPKTPTSGPSKFVDNPPGYIDPKTDPDRPSLATAAILSNTPSQAPPIVPKPLFPTFIKTGDMPQTASSSTTSDSSVSRTAPALSPIPGPQGYPQNEMSSNSMSRHQPVSALGSLTQSHGSEVKSESALGLGSLTQSHSSEVKSESALGLGSLTQSHGSEVKSESALGSGSLTQSHGSEVKSDSHQSIHAANRQKSEGLFVFSPPTGRTQSSLLRDILSN